MKEQFAHRQLHFGARSAITKLPGHIQLQRVEAFGLCFIRTFQRLEPPNNPAEFVNAASCFAQPDAIGDVRLDQRVFFQQRQKARHLRGQPIFFSERIPINRDLSRIFFHQPANNCVTEVARHARAGEARDFRIVER